MALLYFVGIQREAVQLTSCICRIETATDRKRPADAGLGSGIQGLGSSHIQRDEYNHVHDPEWKQGGNADIYTRSLSLSHLILADLLSDDHIIISHQRT